MKPMRKVYALISALLLIGMTACQGNSPGPGESASQSEGTASSVEIPTSSGEPKFGGTLTVGGRWSTTEPPGWFVQEAPSVAALFYINPYQEFLITGDVLNKGPRGTNEGSYGVYQAELPENLLIGNLAESWEATTDPLGVKLKVRPGVMWTGNDNIGMAPREYTAEDMAYVINSYIESAKADKVGNFMSPGAAKVLDDSTVQIEFDKPFASWSWVLGYVLYSNHFPKEMVEADPYDWRNAVGTGPFILTDYIAGSVVNYKRNDNWWGKNQVVNGTTYEAPFIDELSLPIFGDEATMISALRAGKIDILDYVSPNYKETLAKTSPDLLYMENASGMSLNMVFNQLSGPLQDRELRRAIMLGTDQDAIAAAIPGSNAGGFPFSESLGETIYTPPNEMPEDIAKLFTYNPEEAAQTIKDLGYEGETITIHYMSSVAEQVAAAELLEYQWSQIGLNVSLNVVDPAVHAGYNTGKGEEWSGVLLQNGGNCRTSRGIENEREKPYLSVHTDKWFNEQMDKMMAEPDGNIRDKIMKEAGVYFIGQVDEIALVEMTTLTYWWPWVKNYYGEVDVGSTNMNPMLATLWIDQELKKSMGF